MRPNAVIQGAGSIPIAVHFFFVSSTLYFCFFKLLHQEVDSLYFKITAVFTAVPKYCPLPGAARAFLNYMPHFHGARAKLMPTSDSSAQGSQTRLPLLRFDLCTVSMGSSLLVCHCDSRGLFVSVHGGGRRWFDTGSPSVIFFSDGGSKDGGLNVPKNTKLVCKFGDPCALVRRRSKDCPR